MEERLNLADSFSSQTAKTPQSVAVISPDRSLTYQELNERSDKLAGYLQTKGIGTEDLVILCIERSVEMIVAILGVLKSGAAYVPVDPSYPPARVSMILEDTAATIALSSNLSRDSLPRRKDLDIVLLDQDWPLIESLPLPAKPVAIAPEYLAYVIYTSGSTGIPKGVAIEHGAVLNLIRSQTRTFNISPQERILQFSNYCFDASVEQFFLALLNGASLVLFREGLQRDIPAFESFLNIHTITHLHGTPSFLDLIDPSHCPGLTRVIAGGELCKKELARNWSTRVDFYNEYGPTETTVTSLEYYCRGTAWHQYPSLPIGMPLLQTSAYILDDMLREVPEGETGELYLAGAGVGRGYLNRPELTALSFIPDSIRKIPGARMYKTGDQVRRLRDGSVFFIGRTDEQVKIRGYRVELGEIENVLLQSGIVRQGVIVARIDSQGNNRLIGYVVPKEDYSHQAVLTYLSGKLPEYMVPAMWVELESLPLTTNGKVDKKALPDPAYPTQDITAFQLSDLEQQVAGIWKELLGIETVGTQQTFFELGGYSLSLAKMSIRMNTYFGMEIPPGLLLEDPTVGKLAAYIATSRSSFPASVCSPSSSDSPITAPEHELREVTMAQKNFYIHNKLNPRETFPSSQIIMEVTGEVDQAKLGSAFERVIGENDIIRTSYFLEKGKILQQLHNDFVFTLQLVRLQDTDIDHKITDLTTPFDLSVVPLIRVFYIDTGLSHGYIFIDMPHINSDGATMELIIRETADIYNDLYDETPRLQFADFQKYLFSYSNTPRYKEAEAFWKGQLAGGIPLIRFPAPNPESGSKSYNGITIVWDFPLALLDKLHDFLIGRNVTKFQLLLAAYFLLLYKTTLSNDIPVTVPVQNRTRKGFERIMGLLANALVLRMKIEEGDTIAVFLGKCKDVLLRCIHHQEYPHEKLTDLCKELGFDRKKAPITQTFFNYHADDSTYRLGNAILKQYVPAKRKEVLPLAVDIFDTGLNCTFRISSTLGVYDKDELELMTDNYFAILHEMIIHEGDSVKDVFAKITQCEKAFS